MDYVCDICSATDTFVVTKPTPFTVEGHTFEIPDTFRTCSSCNARVFDDEYDQVSHVRLLAAKRTRGARMKLGLSQSQLALLLGWGVATVQRYEGGGTNPTPDHLHELGELFEVPALAWEKLIRARERIDALSFAKMQQKLHTFEQIWLNDPYNLPAVLPYYRNSNEQYTGNRPFNARKLVNMALYFAQKGVLKTKLMKLLWYSDFLSFKTAKLSISGTPYQNQKFGPVPMKHGALLDELVDRNVLHYNMEEVNNYTFEEFRSKHDFDPTQFTIHELQCLEKINQLFMNRSSVEVSELSHREAAWTNTDRYDIIPYRLAEKLTIDL